MALPVADRERVVACLSSPAIQITLYTESGSEKQWTAPKALLCKNSGYFRRLREFSESQMGMVTFDNFEADTFGLFVEYIYFGQYTSYDSLRRDDVRHSAKAWILDDYLDAPHLQNFAMEHLYNIYAPQKNSSPKSSVGPAAMSYYLDMTYESSKLRKFFLDVLVAHWHDTKVVHYSTNFKEWEEIWDIDRDARNHILFWTNIPCEEREERFADLEHWLEDVERNEDN